MIFGALFLCSSMVKLTGMVQIVAEFVNARFNLIFLTLLMSQLFGHFNF